MALYSTKTHIRQQDTLPFSKMHSWFECSCKSNVMVKKKTNETFLLMSSQPTSAFACCFALSATALNWANCQPPSLNNEQLTVNSHFSSQIMPVCKTVFNSSAKQPPSLPPYLSRKRSALINKQRKDVSSTRHVITFQILMVIPISSSGKYEQEFKLWQFSIFANKFSLIYASTAASDCLNSLLIGWHKKLQNKVHFAYDLNIHIWWLSSKKWCKKTKLWYIAICNVINNISTWQCYIIKIVIVTTIIPFTVPSTCATSTTAKRIESNNDTSETAYITYI